jgi:molybdopterin-guanine dinucleotide biosynthesis protein A
MPDRVSVAILAGGQSSRMGENKALVTIGGLPLINRVISRVSSLSEDLFIVADAVEVYAHLGLPVYPDLIPGKGPLGGLYTAINHAQGGDVLVVSCDQPFLNTSLLRYLLDLRAGYDVVVPLNRENYPQSMHAVYGKRCAAPIRQDINADRLKVIGFFPAVRVRQVAGAEIDRFDPHRYSFMNVNTPHDLTLAQQLAITLDDLSG